LCYSRHFCSEQNFEFWSKNLRYEFGTPRVSEPWIAREKEEGRRGERERERERERESVWYVEPAIGTA